MMKKLLLLFICLAFMVSGFSQVTNEGKPASWKALNNAKKISANVLPSFDLEAIKAQDLINDATPGKPWRFGYLHDVNLGFEDGQWDILPNGDRVFRMLISSPEAKSINVIFDEFYMPKGGKVYLYSDDRSDLLGAYTDVQNPDTGILATWLVKGDSVWIEYFEPAEVAGQGRLRVDKATHGYRNAETYKEAKALNDSGDCNLDVDCSIGSDWENLKNHNKKSVGILLTNGSGFCSGALINNVNNDGTPYFLTANHCFSNPAAWAFRFGWISPDASCATTTPSTNGPTNMTISGGTLRARDEVSDFCLVEINSAVPAAWDRVYAGWDKTDITPEFSVGIHHPAGDIMKVCRDDSPLTKEINAGAQTWEITDAGDGWEIGVTEGGSSGSPLFGDTGKIIGQLYGGAAACSGTVDNDRLDYYGRFAISWEGAGTSATRLRDWLDPDNTSPDVLESNPPFQALALDGSLSISVPEIECGNTEAIPVITLSNPGAGDITSAVITWNIDGGADTTINFSGTIAQNQAEQFSLGTQTFGEGTTVVNATLVSVNGVSDENAGNDVRQNEVVIDPGFTTEQFHFELLTDNWAQETTWEFRTLDGTVLNSGGPYQTDVDDNTVFTADFDVDPDTCYVFEIFDTAGDGVCCGFGMGSYMITDDNGNVVFSGGEFGASEATEMRVNQTFSVDDFSDNSISLFPNPAQNEITLSLTTVGNYNYKVINALGQGVSAGKLNSQANTIGVSNLSTGLYFVQIENETTNQTIVKKFVKK